jgi:hypothetical protein
MAIPTQMIVSRALRTTSGVIFAVVMTAIATGCGAKAPPFVPVGASDQRIAGLGLSVLPPAGERWYVARQDTGKTWKLAFSQAPAPDDAGKSVRTTTFILVDSEHVGRASLDKKYPTDREALEHIRQQLDASPSSQFRTIQNDSSWAMFHGVECLRNTTTVEERGNRADPRAVLVTRTQHLFCFHPQDRDIGLWIMASQRFVQGTNPPPLEPLTEEFLQNVRFEALKQRKP